MHEKIDSTRRQIIRGGFALAASAPLIGSKGSAAEPTRELLENYATWLHFERRYLIHQMYSGNPDMDGVVRMRNAGARFHYDSSDASSRAATVLQAVGCDWRA